MGGRNASTVKCCRVLYARSFVAHRIIVKPTFSYSTTNINLLESDVRSENMYVYSRPLQQPKYRYLENLFSKISSIDEIGYFTFSNSNVVLPSEARNSIFIFDDVACDEQDAMREYFSMGRHANYFYLCKRILKQLILDNTNLLILFKLDDSNLKHVYNDRVNTDVVRRILRVVPRLLVTKIWIRSNRQR